MAPAKEFVECAHEENGSLIFLGRGASYGSSVCDVVSFGSMDILFISGIYFFFPLCLYYLLELVLNLSYMRLFHFDVFVGYMDVYFLFMCILLGSIALYFWYYLLWYLHIMHFFLSFIIYSSKHDPFLHSKVFFFLLMPFIYFPQA